MIRQLGTFCAASSIFSFCSLVTVSGTHGISEAVAPFSRLDLLKKKNIAANQNTPQVWLLSYSWVDSKSNHFLSAVEFAWKQSEPTLLKHALRPECDCSVHTCPKNSTNRVPLKQTTHCIYESTLSYKAGLVNLVAMDCFVFRTIINSWSWWLAWLIC